MSWIGDHWKTIAVAAVSVAVGVGLTVATGGLLGVPALAALGGGVVGGGGLAAALAASTGAIGSALTSYLLGQELAHRAATVQGALTAAALGLALNFGGLGVARGVGALGSALIASAPRTASAVAGETLADATVALSTKAAPVPVAGSSVAASERAVASEGPALPETSAVTASKPSETRGFITALDEPPPLATSTEAAREAARALEPKGDRLYGLVSRDGRVIAALRLPGRTTEVTIEGPSGPVAVDGHANLAKAAGIAPEDVGYGFIVGKSSSGGTRIMASTTFPAEPVPEGGSPSFVLPPEKVAEVKALLGLAP